MKRFIVQLTVAALLVLACSGGEFGTVGKKFDKEANAGKMIEGNFTKGYFKEENGKMGYVVNEQIAIPAVFDNITALTLDTEGKELFVVEKGEKRGIVRAFDKQYTVPCEYQKVDATPAKNWLFLQKAGENTKTYRMDTGEKWDGNAAWPPKEFPADVPFKMLSDLQYWKIESITCLGRANKPGLFAFKLKGTGLGDSSSAFQSAKQITFYPEEEGANQINAALKGIYFFPDVKKDEPFEMEFTGLWDYMFQDIQFVGYLIDK